MHSHSSFHYFNNSMYVYTYHSRIIHTVIGLGIQVNYDRLYMYDVHFYYKDCTVGIYISLRDYVLVSVVVAH